MYCSSCYNQNRVKPSSVAYICCSESEKVAIIDIIQRREVGKIPCGVGSSPFLIVIDPMHMLGYVADHRNKTLIKIDLIHKVVMDKIDLIDHPRAMEISPCGCRIYVVYETEPLLQGFDNMLQNIFTMRLNSYSRGIALIDYGVEAYVSQPELNLILKVNLVNYQIVEAIHMGIDPGRIAYSSKRGLLGICSRGDNSLILMSSYCRREEYCNCCDRNTHIPLNGRPSGITFSNKQELCLVTLPFEGEVVAIDTCSFDIVSRIKVGELPGGIASSNRYPLSVVSNQGSNDVIVFNTDHLEIEAKLSVGLDPVGTAIIF